MKSSPVHIFVGPSAGESKFKVPDYVTIHPPIRRFDLEKLGPGPGQIVIVDGVFNSTQSISLTEIRDSLSRGWNITGLSSMGALRAIEAGPLGMRGEGVVYRWLRRFQVEDDDEVAQVIDPETGLAVSQAMVELRAFIQKLFRSGFIDKVERSALISECKRSFFPGRNLTDVARSPILQKHSAEVQKLILDFESPKNRDFRKFMKRLGHD